MMNHYNSLSIGLVSYLKKWSNNSVGSPPTINIPEQRKMIHSYGIFIFLFTMFLGLSSSNAIAQTTLIGSGGNGGFETGSTLTANNWVGVTSSTDAWVVGTAPGVSAGTNCAYISSNGGAAYTYGTVGTIEHLYTDVTIPAGQTSLTLTFKWKAGGEGTGANDWDNLKVFWGLASTITPTANGAVVASNQVSGNGAVGVFPNLQYKLSSASYNSATISLSGIAGQTYRLVFSWKSDAGDIANPPAAIDEVNLVANTTTAYTSVQGGLWSSGATWSGGVVPPSQSSVTISAGHIVTQNQDIVTNNLTIDGTLQHSASAAVAFITQIRGKVLINPTGRYLPYNSDQGFVTTLQLFGDFENNGYANLFLTSLRFELQGAAGTLLNGSGTFQGDGVGARGVVRNITYANDGANVINTAQNLVISSGYTQLSSSVNTNGKISFDNTVQLHGQAINTSVANLVVTAMGSAYSTAPVVFGLSVVQYADGLAAVLNNRYVYQNNVYACTSAGTFNSTPPTFTALNTLDSTSGPELLYIGQIGTLGTPAPYNQALTVGTNYFYAGNLYAAVATTASTTMPTHISGVTGSYLYIGTPATASVNWDATTQTVRSLTLNNAGTGLATNVAISAQPSVTFSRGDLDTTGTGAAATAVVFTRITPLAIFNVQKSSGYPLTGGVTSINSDAGASVLSSNHPQSSSGLGNLSTFNGGVNYTVAPTVGFSPPTTLNLVTDQGSGYTATPTIVVSGGTLVSGSPLVSGNFTITVNSGSVVSVYYTAVTGSAATTPTYSVLPTLSFSSGNAMLAWPANCLPAATANIGANGQLLSYTITNRGYGYLSNVTAAAGTIPANAGIVVGLLGGTFTTAAAAPTPVVASYTFITNFFGGGNASTATMTVEPDTFIPANRKMTALQLNGNGLGINLTNNLTLIGGVPFLLGASGVNTGNVCNLGGNNLNFTWHGYTGITGTYNASVGIFGYVKNGSISYTHKGGIGTLTFPFSGAGAGPYTAGFVFNKGLTPTAITTGSTVKRITVTETAAPSNTSLGTGFAKGSRAYRLQNEAGAVHGTTPTATLSFNDTDALTGVTQNVLFVAESASLSGAWNSKTAAYGPSGVLPSNGLLATPLVAPGPIAPTGDTYYGWATTAPTVTNVNPTTICASSGAFTITGTDLITTSAITIGGTPVSSFVVVNGTTITGVAGPGTSGNLVVTTVGGTATGPSAISLLAVPAAPTVSLPSLTVNYGVAANVTASGTGPTFNWYSAASAGTLLQTGATFNSLVCASTTIYAAQSNGTCEGPRTPVVVTVNQRVISATVPTFCGAGGSTVLSITPVAGATAYAWTNISGGATITAGATTTSATVTVTQTSDFSLLITGPGACTATVFYSVSVNPLPTATVTSTAQGVCPGTNATINSGLSATNFTSTTIPYSTRTPVNAVALAAGGNAVTPMTGTFDLDDGGWGAIPIGFSFNFFGTSYTTINVGTNGLVQFGAYNGNFGFQSPPGINDYDFTFLPNPSEPVNMVAILANDNDLTNFGAGGGTLSYWTEGIAPNRKFVVDYNAVRQYNPTATTNTSTAQAVFYETTGVIDVNVTGSTSINNKVVGINNGNGTAGALALATSAAITIPVSYRFTPPYNYTTVWTADVGEGPVQIASGTNIFTQAVSPVQTTTYTISYTNQITGCTNALNSAQVVMSVLTNVAPVGVTTLASNAIVCPSSPTTNLSLGNLASLDGLTFQWQRNNGAGYADISGATAATYVATPTVLTTLYRCQIVRCTGTAVPSAAVSVSKPVVTPLTLNASAITLCAGGSQTVLVTSGASYYSSFTWSPNTVTGNQNTGYVFNTAGTYTLTAAAPVNGCSATALVVVTVNTVATTPVVTPASPTYACGAAATLITVGSGFTNPTPVGTPCLLGAQFPVNGTILTSCDGQTEITISNTCFTGEYSVVFTNANSRYTFISDGVGDIVEITNASATIVYARGPSPITWFNNVNAGSVRFYSQNAGCTQELVNRSRSVICLPATSVVFSPATGLFTDASGFVPYDGVTPVTFIYAAPLATQVYSAVSNNVFGCPAAPVNVTVLVAACNSIVNLKLFIEGYYQDGGPAMRPVKNLQDGSSPITDVETITVELHNATSPYAVAATTTAMLKTDGTALCTFPPGTSGSYYIAVRTSNALETWSANPQAVSSVTLNFDFSNSANKAYGANMQNMQGLNVFGIFSGDINQDDVIDGVDAPDLDTAIFNSDFGIQVTDLNGDGSVDGSDSTFYENNSFNSVFANYPQ